MRVALAVNCPGGDREANLQEIIALTDKAANAGANLVVFPEAAITGLINNDDPGHDMVLGEPLSGSTVRRLSQAAWSRSIWLATGLFELDLGRLYDTAILIGPDGKVNLRHRRIHPGWRHPKADPAFYGEGSEQVKAVTPYGSVMFLICGELFHDELTNPVKAKQPDFLVVPIARSMEGGWSSEPWERELHDDYAARVAAVGCTTLMVNLLSPPDSQDGYFGGAWVFRGDGSVLDALPPGRSGLLVADL